MTAQRPKNSRVVSGILMGALVTLGAVLGGGVWALLITVGFYPIAYKEMLALMTAKGIRPSRLTVCVFSPIFYLMAYMGWERHFQVAVTVGLIFTFAWLLLRKKPASISDIGGTIMMFFYLGFLPAHFILIRQLGHDSHLPVWQQSGVFYLMLILLVVSASDIFAYYGGKRFGKNLLSPQISPKKTVEGSVVGTSAAVLVGLVAALAFHLPWYHGLIFAALISLVGQMGDLSESLIKRDAGLKDSGSVIPGHGGLLDRTDSYIFSGAVGYYYIIWFVLHQGLAHEVIELFR